MDKYADFPQWVIKVKDMDGKTDDWPDRSSSGPRNVSRPPCSCLAPMEAEDQDAYSMVIQSRTAEIQSSTMRRTTPTSNSTACQRHQGRRSSVPRPTSTTSGIDIPIPGKGTFGQGKTVRRDDGGRDDRHPGRLSREDRDGAEAPGGGQHVADRFRPARSGRLERGPRRIQQV